MVFCGLCATDSVGAWLARLTWYACIHVFSMVCMCVCVFFLVLTFCPSPVLASRVLVSRVLVSRVLVSRVLVSRALVSRVLVSRVLVFPRMVHPSHAELRIRLQIRGAGARHSGGRCSRRKLL